MWISTNYYHKSNMMSSLGFVQCANILQYTFMYIVIIWIKYMSMIHVFLKFVPRSRVYFLYWMPFVKVRVLRPSAAHPLPTCFSRDPRGCIHTAITFNNIQNYIRHVIYSCQSKASGLVNFPGYLYIYICMLLFLNGKCQPTKIK